jgi:predicted metal-dependent hydrolase
MDRETVCALVERLNRDAAQIAVRFGLAYRSIEAEKPRVKRRYGVCYADGRIRIRLRHNATGEPLKYSSLVNTLCHELAHLKHFNHGERFKAFYLRLLEYARREGIYQPSQRTLRPARTRPHGAPARLDRPSRPEQLTLFG